MLEVKVLHEEFMGPYLNKIKQKMEMFLLKKVNIDLYCVCERVPAVPISVEIFGIFLIFRFNTWTIFESSRFGHEKQENLMKQFFFLALLYRYINSSFFFYILMNPGWLNVLLFVLKPVFYRTKLLNSENWLLHEWSQICKTMCI